MRKSLFSLALVALMLPFGAEALPTVEDQKPLNIVYINGVKYHIHTVQAGESLSSIARLYGIALEELERANPTLSEVLREEQSIKVPVRGTELEQQRPQKPRSAKEEKRLKRSFLKHTVESGETLYAISRRYHISIDTILEDNPDADPQHLSVGQELLIRKTEIGQTDDQTAQAEMAAYEERLNESVGDGYIYHVVEPKETIYSLAREFGMTQEDFIALNHLEDGLKAGSIVKFPASDRSEQTPVQEQIAPEAELQTEERIEVVFNALNPTQRLHTALLLPLTTQGKLNPQFTAFYQGFLMGLEEVKQQGYSIELSLFDTQKSLSRVEEICADSRFLDADLIVGPVYADGMEPVIRHAEAQAIPVVTPLGDLSHLNSDVLFQMAPTNENKYDKLRPLLDEGATITLIRTSKNDKEFEAEILKQLEGYTYQYYDYASVQGVEHAERSDLTPLLEQSKKHLLFVLPDNEVDVDRILASLASAHTNMVARSLGNPEYRVVGSSRWNRYTNIDRTTFFKNRVVLFSLLHAKRDSEVVKHFDSRYIASFGAIPTLYAYRGYETAVIFCRGMFSDIAYDMEGRRYHPLQTFYAFKQKPGSLTHLNQEWVRVSYNADFTISIE